MAFDTVSSLDLALQQASARNFWQRRILGINGPVKRAFDMIASACALLFLAPLLLTIALVIRLEGGGPVLFRQMRVGRDGKLFGMLKFRTMHTDAEARLNAILAADPAAAREWAQFQKLSRDPRITRAGRFLRISSLDELPQLINVLFGDMSVVGQRPILPGQADAYGVHLSAYKAARPGLTGLWQVSGRNATTFQRRAELGTQYLTRWTLVFDIWIVLRTFPALLARQTS